MDDQSSNASSSFDESVTSRARNRRPDKQLYVPKAKRSDEPITLVTSDSAVVDVTSSVKNVVQDSNLKQNITDKVLLIDETNKTKTKNKKKILVSDSKTKGKRSETVLESVRDESLDPTCSLEKESLSSMLETDLKASSCDEPESEHCNIPSIVDLQTLEVKQSIESFSTDEVFVKDAIEENDRHSTDRDFTERQLNPPYVAKTDASQQRRKSSSGESWDALYDQSGECLDSSLLDQLTEKVGKVTIETPQIDYWSTPETEASSSLIDEELGHVVEIYDFPVVFKTQDLITAFSQFKDRGFDIKWVDDTHALGVFSSRVAAREALSLKHPFIKTRPLSQAIKESRRKAQRTSEFLQPYKTRPETSALLARRLVAGALGLQVQVSKEQREEDLRKLKEAKERKRLVVKQKEAAWNGDVHD